MDLGWFQSKGSGGLWVPSVARRVRRARLCESRSRRSSATSFSQVSIGEALALVSCSSRARIESCAARKPSVLSDSRTSFVSDIVALQRMGDDVSVADMAAQQHVERDGLVCFATQ